MASLERCPFLRVSFIERFHCRTYAPRKQFYIVLYSYSYECTLSPNHMCSLAALCECHKLIFTYCMHIRTYASYTICVQCIRTVCIVSILCELHHFCSMHTYSMYCKYIMRVTPFLFNMYSISYVQCHCRVLCVFCIIRHLILLNPISCIGLC